VTITAVQPPDAASDPKHPDHDRWVKDRTLKMEIEHAQLVGLTLRDAEAENARMLARAEQKAKEAPTVVAKPSPIAREQRHAARGITRKAPKNAGKPECSCGLCIPCRRKMRVLAIFRGRAAGHPVLFALSEDIKSSFVVRIRDSIAGVRKGALDRALAARIDAICDRSIPTMGEWRK